MTPQPPFDQPAIVLDSNVVLDWLVFNNPTASLLASMVMGGRVRWIASAAMREELGFVLACGTLVRWKPDVARLWRTWEEWVSEVAAVPPSGDASRLRCRDRDDQKFIDLALGQGAHWLLSRDKAVLALRKRAAPLGLTICTPEQWVAGPAQTLPQP